MFGQVGGGIDALGVLHIEVGQKHDTQAVAHVAVVVDDLAHAVDELDDEFGGVVAGRRLAAEDDGAFVALGVELEPAVERDGVQYVEVLTLVLVDAFDLHVEHGLGITLQLVLVPRAFGQGALVVELDLVPLFDEAGIVDEFLQFAQLGEVGDPLVPDGFGDERAQAGIGQHEKAARGDAVGLVAELLG